MHSDPGCDGRPRGASSAAGRTPAPGATAPARSCSRRQDQGRRARSCRCAAQAHRGPALVHVAHALEGLGVGAQPEQGTEAVFVGGVLQRLVAGEDGREVRAVHVRGEHEVDEAALVAAPAPVVEPLGRVLVEGAVAAAEGAVVAGEAGEALRDPQLACAAAGRRTRRGRGPSAARTRSREATLELLALGPLVVDRLPVGDQCGHRRGPLVGQHDGVAPLEHGGDDRRRRDDRGDGHVPVEEPQLIRAADERIDLPGDVRDGQPGHAPPRPQWRRSGRRAGGRTHSAASGWSADSDSTVTMESMPPPKGISGRPASGS